MTRRAGLWTLLSALLLASISTRSRSQEIAGNGVVGASGLMGQTQSSAQSPRTIRGTVVNSVTGEPIYRALVQVGGQYAMLTDHDGHFEFTGVTLSGIPPWAMKPGFFAQDHSQRFLIPPSDTNSQSAPDIIMKLAPEAIISGTVTGQDGNPIEGIPVQLKTLITQEGLTRWRPRMQTRTNAEGQYRFAELNAGKYIVTTGFHIEGLADSQAASGYIPARYPPAGGSSSSSETAMVLKPGDHSVADLNPEMEKLFPVTGTIAGYGQSRGVSFRAETASGEEFTPAVRFTPRNGEFRVMLPGGSYRMTATAYMRQGPMEATREITVPQAPVSGLSFTMEPYATIPVDLELDSVNQPGNGTAQAGGTPSPENLGGNISLSSASGEGFTPYLSARPSGGSGENQSGPLVIDNVSPGRYILRADPPSPWYVAAASCGGVDLVHDALAIGEGSPGCSIRVVLRNDSGSVHVTVRGAEQDTASATQRQLFVYAVPLGNLPERIVTLSQQNGDYSADGVAPGRYLVFAFDQLADLPYRDPEAMRAYAERGQEISVTANGKADAEVALSPGAP